MINLCSFYVMNERLDCLRHNNKEMYELSEDIKIEIISWIKLIVTAFAIAFILKTFVFQIAYVKGPSMKPTLYEGQVLIISKINYFIGTPSRGEIVVVHDKLAKKDLIKRVIGIPNETIEIKNAHVYINDIELNPDYTKLPTDDNGFEKSKVPDENYFVMGDNRPESRDSRSESLGFVKKANIVGRAVFRVWPMDKFGGLR